MADINVTAQAELALLGAIIDGGKVTDAAEHITADSFHIEAHRILFEAMVALDSDGVRPSSLELLTYLAKRNIIDQVGGPTVIHDLAAMGLRSDTVRYAREVAGEAWRRRAQDTARRLYEAASDHTIDPADVLATVTSGLEEGVPEPERLPLYIGDEIDTIPDPEWLVDGIVAQGLAMVVGPYASGKSMVTIDMALCVANGIAWWGHATRRRRVLYIAAEGVSGVKKRMQAWVAEHHGTDKANVALYGQPLNLHKPRDAARLDALVRRVGAELVVLDTWARMTAGENENDNGLAGAAVEVLDRIAARRDCDVWAVHHTGASGEGPRGATALPGAADTGVMTKRDGKTVTVSCFKQKDAEEFDQRRFVIVGHQSGGATLQKKVDAGPRTHAPVDINRAEVLRMLKGGPVTRMVLERDHGLDVVRDMCNHPDVVEGRDEQGRRVLVHQSKAHTIDPLTAV